MFLRHAIVVIAAVVLATVGAVMVSAAEPNEAEAASAVRACGGGKIKLNAKEERTLHLHNQARKNRGLRALCVHPKLTRAARAHSAEMIRKDYFGHGNTGGRLKRYGYKWSTYGENIGWGPGSRGSPAAIFDGWMDSRGHRSNILAKKFQEVGIGTATDTFKGHKNTTMYTVDFGTRR
jgi:uncharacterized protein YkwD